MTNLEAIRNDIIYPLEDGKLEKALIDRGVEPSVAYSLSGKSLLELVRADLCVKLVTAPNIQEGGIIISMTDKSNLMKIASAIYIKNGEKDPFAVISPTVTGASPW